jgi:response regulator of citrate/malate metabolism
LVKRLLIAEPDPAVRGWLHSACADLADVTVCGDFQSARMQLLDAPPDLLITNLRLEDYNGLHLILLGKSAGSATRCIVHTDRPDLYLIREAQALGAFFEQTNRLPHALIGYLHFSLPGLDRRDPDRIDRRAQFRGGRRAADQPVTV